MRRWRAHSLLLLGMFGLNAQTRLSLSTTSITPAGVASLDLSLDSSSGVAPAAVQWSLQFPLSSILSAGVTAGPAVGPGKNVLCNSNPAGFSCMAGGANANVIPDGVIARVTATLAPGVNGASVRLADTLAATPEGYFAPITGSGADFSRPSAAAPTPALVTPAASADVPLNTPLSWTGQASAFDVYFGAWSPPPLIASNFAGTKYNPGPLAPCTTYYWRAVAKSAGVNSSSAVYAFATMASVQLSRDVDTVSSAGGNASVQVASASGCAWKATPHPADTVTVTSGLSGVGNGPVNYSISPNGGFASRAGYIDIADQQFAVLQDGAGPPSRCVTRVTGPAFIDSSAQMVTLSVAADPGCNWTLSDNHVDWAAPSGSENTPTVAVAANASGASRSDDFAAVPFASATYSTPFTLTQRATPATFADVAVSHPFFDATGMLRARSITDGCASAPLRFCPDDNITRGQMAVFLVRSILGGDGFSYRPAPYFDDTPATHPFFKWIQKMWEMGVTNGCGPAAYCPDAPVTRGQMAVFIIRARLGASAQFDVPLDPLFNDIAGSSFYRWIQKMGQLGITTGCAAGVYCPDAPVTRGQMAVFIMRGAFNQLLPSARPIVVSVAPDTASPGQTVTIAITGRNTYFDGGAPQVLAGPGITTVGVSVTSATSMTAQLRIAAEAALGPRSITVAVPGEIEATLPNGFRVQ